jgi:DNA-binding transcriptional regulator YiaG
MPKLGTKRDRDAELRRKRVRLERIETNKRDRAYWTAPRIRELRIGLNMTQEEFAARIPVVFAAVNRWENSKGKPNLEAIKRLKSLQRTLERRREKGMVMTPPEVLQVFAATKLTKPEFAELVGVGRDEPGRWLEGRPPSTGAIRRICLLNRAIKSAATASIQQ